MSTIQDRRSRQSGTIAGRRSGHESHYKAYHNLKIRSVSHPTLELASFQDLDEDSFLMRRILENEGNNRREILRAVGDRFSVGSELHGTHNVDFYSACPYIAGGPANPAKPPYYVFVKNAVLASTMKPPRIFCMFFLVREDCSRAIDDEYSLRFDNPNGPAIGVTGFSTIEQSYRGTSLITSAALIVVIEPPFQRKGYGIECLMMCIKWGFDYAEFNEITMLVGTSNDSLLRRLQVLLSTDLPDWRGPIRATYRHVGSDEVLFSMVRSDWRGWEYKVLQTAVD